jgi:hypothetical protein
VVKVSGYRSRGPGFDSVGIPTDTKAKMATQQRNRVFYVVSAKMLYAGEVGGETHVLFRDDDT